MSNDIQALFDRDPCQYSEQDIGQIVARTRQNRAQYELGVKAPVAPKAAKAPKPTKGGSDLKDLGLI